MAQTKYFDKFPLINYGNRNVQIDSEDEDGKKIFSEMAVAEVIVHELKNDNIEFENPFQIHIEEFVHQEE